MLTVKLQYFGLLIQRADSFEKTLMLRKIEGRRRRRRQRIRWLDGIIDSIDMDLGGLRALVMDREACFAVVHGVTKSRTWLSNWTELSYLILCCPLLIQHSILQSKGLSSIFFSTTVWKHQLFGTQSSLWSNSHISTWPLEKPQLWLGRLCQRSDSDVSAF